MGSSGRVALALVLGSTVVAAACAARPVRHVERRRPPDPASLPRASAGPIPPRARSRAIEQAQADGLLSRSPGGWVPAGPDNGGGRMSALAADPNNFNRIWAGAADGGVFLSTDGGDTWTPMFDGQTVLTIGAIATHPTDSNVVYVGTGEEGGGQYSYDGEGVYRTTDGGATWTFLGLAETRHIGKIAIDRLNAQRIFVAAGGGAFDKDANRGVYRSSDGGATWTKVLYIADDTGAVDVAVDPTDGGRVFAAVWQRNRADNTTYVGGPNSGVWRSLDGGTTWTRLTNGFPTGANVGRIGIAIARTAPQTMYATVYDTDAALLGIYKTTNGGDRWSKTSSNSLASQFASYGWYLGQIRVNPGNADDVFALDAALWRSTDGGKNWATVVGGEGDVHDLIFGGAGKLVSAGDGGISRSVNNGSQWSGNGPLAVGQLYDICVDPHRTERRMGGLQDTGVRWTKTGATFNWGRVWGGDGTQCEFDPVNGNTIYVAAQDGDIGRSIDGGVTFTPSFNGIDPVERANWAVPLTADPVTAGTVYTGYQHVYRSTDAGANWTAVSPDLTSGPGTPFSAEVPPNPVRGTVTVVAVSPVNTSVLWAGTDDGNVWVTSDGGGHWTRRNPPTPAYWVTEITADPFDASTAYLAVTGFRSGVRNPYLRVTHDLGVSLQDLSAGLPQVPVNAVVPDPAWHGRLFAGTDIGVESSDDFGTTWSLLGSGLPWVVVQDLVLLPASRLLFAGTYARSMYSFDLSQVPPPDGDGDGADNNADCAPSDAGAFAVPDAVATLSVDRGAGAAAALSWSSRAAQAGTATTYDVERGDIASLAVSGTSGASVIASALAATTLADADPLPPGGGVFYFVRGGNDCGAGPWEGGAP